MVVQYLLNLAYSNLWIAFSAAGAAYMNARLLGVEAPRSILLCGISMYLVYTFAKTVRCDPQADFANDPERMEFLQRWRKPLIALAGVLFILGTVLCRGDFAQFLLFIYPILGAAAYDVKWLPASFRYRRLKDVTGVKSLFVAFIWGTTNVLMPAYEAGVLDRVLAIKALILYNTMVMFVNTVYFDLGDVKGDRLEGVVTLPIALGFSRTLVLLHLVNVLAAVTLWGSLQMGWISGGGRLITGMLVFNFSYLVQARNEDSDIGFWCDVVADAVFLAAAVMLIAG